MKNSKKIVSGIGALVVLLIGTFFVAENQQITEPAKDTQRIAIELERVVDGDTIIMKENGERKRMRLLLIDTPESNTNKTGKTQPFGKEAKEFLTDYLKGKELSIVYDENHEKVDQYDRTLAYLYANDQLVEEVLLKEGLARLGYYNEKELYFNELKKSESEAKKAKKHIWSLTNYVGEKGFKDNQ